MIELVLPFGAGWCCGSSLIAVLAAVAWWWFSRKNSEGANGAVAGSHEAGKRDRLAMGAPAQPSEENGAPA